MSEHMDFHAPPVAALIWGVEDEPSRSMCFTFPPKMSLLFPSLVCSRFRVGVGALLAFPFSLRGSGIFAFPPLFHTFYAMLLFAIRPGPEVQQNLATALTPLLGPAIRITSHGRGALLREPMTGGTDLTLSSSCRSCP
jgi:hypothetical protein